MGQWLSERLGQQFIVDNRLGAGTNVGTEAVVNAALDGTLLLATNPNAVNAALYEKLNTYVKDSPGVHRLRQGKRNDGRCRHGSRALSRRSAR
jgi:tripartite-type tricarboxylate transporter receptor subunit TctC